MTCRVRILIRIPVATIRSIGRRNRRRISVSCRVVSMTTSTEFTRRMRCRARKPISLRRRRLTTPRGRGWMGERLYVMRIQCKIIEVRELCGI